MVSLSPLISMQTNSNHLSYLETMETSHHLLIACSWHSSLVSLGDLNLCQTWIPCPRDVASSLGVLGIWHTSGGCNAPSTGHTANPKNIEFKSLFCFHAHINNVHKHTIHDNHIHEYVPSSDIFFGELGGPCRCRWHTPTMQTKGPRSKGIQCRAQSCHGVLPLERRV